MPRKEKEQFKRIIEVQEDENGEAFIQIPEEALEKLGWNDRTPLDISLDGGTIVLKEKRVWELEDFKENLEMILDDVFVNKIKHTIRHNNRLFTIK